MVFESTYNYQRRLSKKQSEYPDDCGTWDSKKNVTTTKEYIAFSITMHGGVCTVVLNILHNCICQSKRTFKPCYSLLVCIVSTQGRIFPFYNDNGSRVVMIYLLSLINLLTVHSLRK
jgi:hypothetical protein